MVSVSSVIAELGWSLTIWADKKSESVEKLEFVLLAGDCDSMEYEIDLLKESLRWLEISRSPDVSFGSLRGSKLHFRCRHHARLHTPETTT